MLVGIIVNNGIVLVDCINQERLGGMERREAIIEAGVTRLRPILMTSLTTILGPDDHRPPRKTRAPRSCSPSPSSASVACSTRRS